MNISNITLNNVNYNIKDAIMRDKIVFIKDYKVDGASDTAALKNAIIACNDTRSIIMLENDYEYHITETIDIPFYITLAVDGCAYIIYEGSGYVFHITRGSRTYSETIKGLAMDTTNFMECGNMTISYKDNTAISSNQFVAGGVEVDTSDADNTHLTLFNFNINNVSFYKLNVGVHLEARNMFSIGVVACVFVYCTNGLYFGSNNSDNAGERMFAKDCMFKNCGIGFRTNTSGGTYNILNSSFDLNVCCHYSESDSPTHTFDGCHFEAMGSTQMGVIDEYMRQNFPNAICKIVYIANPERYQAGNMAVINSMIHMSSITNAGEFMFDGVTNHPYNTSNLQSLRTNTLNLNNTFFSGYNNSKVVLANNKLFDLTGYNVVSYNSNYALMIDHAYETINLADGSHGSTDTELVNKGFNSDATITVGDIAGAPYGLTKAATLSTNGITRVFGKTFPVRSRQINYKFITKNTGGFTSQQCRVACRQGTYTHQTWYVGNLNAISLGNGFYMNTGVVRVPDACDNVKMEFTVNTSGDTLKVIAIGCVAL